MWQRGQHVPAAAQVQHAGNVGKQGAGFFPDPLVSTGLSNKAFCLPLNMLGILRLNAIPANSILHGGCMQVRATAKFPAFSVYDTKVVDVT